MWVINFFPSKHWLITQYIFPRKVGICAILALTCSKWEILNCALMAKLSSLIPESPALSSQGNWGSRSAASLETHWQHNICDFIANLTENAKVLTQRRYQQVFARHSLHWSRLITHSSKWHWVDWLQWLTESPYWHDSTRTAILGLNLPPKAWPSICHCQLKIKPDFNICCDNINKQLFLWDVEKLYMCKIPTVSTILTSRTVNSRIEQPIQLIPELALSLGMNREKSHFAWNISCKL